MKLRIALFISLVSAMAAFGLFTQAKAQTAVIISPPNDHFCWGLMCLVAPAIWAEQDRQAREAAGPHPCNVWNGRAWITATCAP